MKIYQICLLFWFCGGVSSETNGFHFQQPSSKWAIAQSYSWVIEPRIYHPNSNNDNSYEILQRQAQEQAEQLQRQAFEKIRQQMEQQAQQQVLQQAQQQALLQARKQSLPQERPQIHKQAIPYVNEYVTPNLNNDNNYEILQRQAHEQAEQLQRQAFEKTRQQMEQRTQQTQQQPQQQALLQGRKQLLPQVQQQALPQIQKHAIPYKREHNNEISNPSLNVIDRQVIPYVREQVEYVTPGSLHNNEITNPSFNKNNYNQHFIDEIVQKVIQKTGLDSNHLQPTTRGEIEKNVREILLEYPLYQREISIIDRMNQNRDHTNVPNNGERSHEMNSNGFSHSSEIPNPQNVIYYPNIQTEPVNSQTECTFNCGNTHKNDGQPIAVAMANAFYPANRLTNGRMLANTFTYTSV